MTRAAVARILFGALFLLLRGRGLGLAPGGVPDAFVHGAVSLALYALQLLAHCGATPRGIDEALGLSATVATWMEDVDGSEQPLVDSLVRRFETFCHCGEQETH